MNNRERWKQIEGYRGYSVSDLGRVESIKRNRTLILKPFPTSGGGAYSVELSRSGLGRIFAVHSLVLGAFVSPRPKGKECRHLDGNPANNRLENLVWGTRIENQHDRLRHGTHNRGERAGAAKLTTEAVLDIRKKYIKGAKYPHPYSSLGLAGEYGVHRVTILYVISRRNWDSVPDATASQQRENR